MEFRSKDFHLSLEGLNKKLGISKLVPIDYYKDFGVIVWNCEVETREWGIKSILTYVSNYELVISYNIEKQDLTSREIQHLLQQDLGEFYPCEEADDHIIGKIRIDNKKYVVNNYLELAGDMMRLNEVIVNFDDYIITVI